MELSWRWLLARGSQRTRVTRSRTGQVEEDPTDTIRTLRDLAVSKLEDLEGIRAVQVCFMTRDQGYFMAMDLSQEDFLADPTADTAGWAVRSRNPRDLTPRPAQLIKSNVPYRTSQSKTTEHGFATRRRSVKRSPPPEGEVEVKKFALHMGSRERCQISSKTRMAIGPALRGHDAKHLIR